MSKKIVFYFIACIFILNPICVSALKNTSDIQSPIPNLLPVASITQSLPAKSAILIDQSSGNVLYEQNPDEILPPASVTKVMTLLLVMEAIDSGKINLQDIVTISEEAASMGGSQIWLEVGEEISVDDLLKAVCVASANDASVALAEAVSGSHSVFVENMNERAIELGMANTHFENCTGLDAAEHYTTARDIAIMSKELMQHPLIAEYSTIWMDTLRNGQTELVNTNKLVRFYKGATGLKTGTTSGAGSCLSATATRDSLSLIAVVMGCNTSDERFASARELLDYGFANYVSVAIPSIENDIKDVKVLGGTKEYAQIVYDTPTPIVVDKMNVDTLEQNVVLAEDVQAPVESGQTLGYVEILIDGEVISTYNLLNKQEIEAMTFPNAFKALVYSLFNIAQNDEAQINISPNSSNAVNISNDTEIEENSIK